jgi:hypothetical protein
MDTIDRQPCAVCAAERQIIHREWIPKGYEIQTLQCLNCQTVMRMVRSRPLRSELRDQPTR